MNNLSAIEAFTLEIAFQPLYDPSSSTRVWILRYGSVTTYLDIYTESGALYVLYNSNTSGENKIIYTLNAYSISTTSYLIIKADYYDFDNLVYSIYNNGVLQGTTSQVRSSSDTTLKSVSLAYSNAALSGNINYAFIRLWKYPLTKNEINRFMYRMLFDKYVDYFEFYADFRYFFNLTTGNFL
jgi:hypothetical protein